MKSLQSLRLGVISSSGGSALAAANDCMISSGKNIEWIVITDRQCGIEDWARVNGHVVHRLAYTSAEEFSKNAFLFFEEMGCSSVLLFYTKRVAKPLIDRKDVWNIHPSLLPAFSGLNGVRDAISAGVRLLGATLHRVDSGLDTGEIVAQVAAPLPSDASQSAANYLSYLQKVWLVLVWIDQLEVLGAAPKEGFCGPGVVVGCPGISDHSLIKSYSEWLLSQNDIEERLK